MRWFISIIFCISAVLSVLLALAPSLLIYATILFIALGPLALIAVTLLAAVPSIAVYSGLMLPWTLSPRNTVMGRNLLIMSLALVGIVALGIPMVGEILLGWQVAQWGKSDQKLAIANVLRRRPRLVELVSFPRRPLGGPPEQAAPCTELCQVVLAEGLAKFVRIKRTHRPAWKLGFRRDYPY